MVSLAVLVTAYAVERRPPPLSRSLPAEHLFLSRTSLAEASRPRPRLGIDDPWLRKRRVPRKYRIYLSSGTIFHNFSPNPWALDAISVGHADRSRDGLQRGEARCDEIFEFTMMTQHGFYERRINGLVAH